ncbi:hybrid sensor histidine kinase/response regulator transcription factor [Labilibacter marinus]|uniref:hybrid sensor histidine kinase/response regulator transcription factor n=1 Tax=Labilibacter marinus TaxID=1477105 RepID=UPI00082B980D|nr:hybrid sensor histidine kinase/response regulator transcription factor [Labilibacter marinus]
MRYKLFLLLFIVCSSIYANSNYYFFQKITPDSDFAFGPVNTVCEDKNGFIWFGCNNGLYYHNTIEIKKAKLFPEQENLSQSILINKVFKDFNDDIWVCSEKGLFKHIRSNNKFEYKPLYPYKSENLKSQVIKNIIDIKPGKYLLHINTGLYTYSESDSTISPLKNEISNYRITYINKDENDIIYIGTNGGNVYISKNQLKDYKLLYNSEKFHITSVCKDGSKYYIGFINEGIDIINLKGTKIGELNSNLHDESYINSNRTRQILKRKQGEIWIATNQGITILHQGKQTILDYNNKVGLTQRTVFSMYEGSNEDIIIGTFGGGVAYYSDYNYAFKYIPIEYDKKLAIRSAASSFCEDNKGYIWVGNEDDGGLKVFDPKINDFLPNFAKALKGKLEGIKTITQVSNDHIAIGRIFSKQLILYNTTRDKIEEYINIPVKETTGIMCSKYHNNTLYLAGRRKLISYDLNTKETKELFNLDSEGPGRIWQLYLDSSHNLWISSDVGLFVKNTGSEEIHKCFTGKSKFTLNKATIYSVCEDNNGLIWVGTKGKGMYIYTPENESVRLAPHHQRTKAADILTIIKDKKGDIWYNTNEGLYYYDVTKDNTSHYSSVDGISGSHIRPNSAYCDKEGSIYLGAINGFNIISPDIVKQNPHPPSVYISEISINNKPLSANNIVSINSLNLTEVNTIRLNAHQNTLSFKVVSNNFIKPDKNKFKYRLLNYEDNWVEFSHNQPITFTQVPAGKYIFEVFGSNNDNIWSDKPYQLHIQILPVIYKRWYAILIYIIVLAIAIFIIHKELDTKLKLRKEINEERLHSKTNDLLYSERLKFFTNISHELRTPLSLIISPVRSLLDKTYPDDNTKNLLKVVDRNAKRLLKITDQTLDLRMLEVGKLEPNFQKHEIIQLTKDVYLCFEQQIIDHQINFSFTSEFQMLETFIDGDMIEKVIYNLFSNALKYTPEKGHVFVSINKKTLSEDDYENFICSGKKFTGKAIEITIRDTGKGIKPELLSHIFERFAKGNESHEVSSGIGLHLCKEYSEMNDGNILLTSNEGIGSSFTLNLPLKEDAKFENNKLNQIIKHEVNENEQVDIPALETTEQLLKHSVLITEDNDELRNYLKKFLGKHFKVITAKSGEQALNILEDLIPDIMITDVSMSGISGIELTKQLKEDSSKQHMPIVVMTAYTERKYQMESILSGADAFLSKPIEESLLLAQINNILGKKSQKENSKDKSESVVEEHNFITKVEKIIERNFHNTQFGIPDLLKILGISKSTLDRKIKAETQQNPSAFIRDVRLKNAIKLMSANKFNIDEIATYVGFNSTSYFIRTFKIKYGVTPKEYRKEQDKT